MTSFTTATAHHTEHGSPVIAESKPTLLSIFESRAEMISTCIQRVIETDERLPMDENDYKRYNEDSQFFYT